jgi:ribosome-associated translation inhibitor RaiA
MQEPLRIAFRNMTAPIGVEDSVRTMVTELERFFDRIIGCQVVIEARHRRHHQGNLYHVRVELSVPDRSIVVGRDPGDDHAYEDLHVAIRDAFEAAKRQLQDYSRAKRGDVKSHNPEPAS